MLDNLRDGLSGYKTYIVAFGAMVAAFVAWSQGSMDSQALIKAVVEATLAMTIRAGIAKAQ